MFKEILVPLDGSPLAEAVLPYATYVAKGYAAKLTLFSVVDADTIEISQQHQEYIIQMTDRSEALLQSYLRDTGEQLKGKNLTVQEVILQGKTADTIVSYAKRQGVGLIAMSTHGRSGMGRWLAGSVTDSVLQLTETPMLVIHPSQVGDQAEVKFNKLVVPLDGSPLAEFILPYVEDMAKHLGLDVQLIQVVQTTSALYMDSEFSEYPVGLLEEIEAAATSYLSSKSQRFSAQGIKCECHVLRGSAATAIIDFAKEVPNPLIAMSTHGRSGLGRVLLGSVADRVIRASGGAVLVFHPKSA